MSLGFNPLFIKRKSIPIPKFTVRIYKNTKKCLENKITANYALITSD